MDDLSFDATAEDAADDAPAASMDAAEAAAELADVPANDSVPGLDEAGDANTAQIDPAMADGTAKPNDTTADIRFDPAAADGADTPNDAADDTHPADQPLLGTTHRMPGESLEIPPRPEISPVTVELGRGPKPPEGWTPGGPEGRG